MIKFGDFNLAPTTAMARATPVDFRGDLLAKGRWLPVTFVTPEKTEHRSIVSFSRNRQNMLQLDLCVAGTTVTHNMQLRVKNYLWCANEAPSRQAEVLFWTRPVHAGDTAMRFRFACALHLKQFMHQVLMEPYEDGLNRIVNQ